MNVMYRIYGPDDYFFETESQTQAFRNAREVAASSGQMVLVSFIWMGHYNMRRFYPDGASE